MLISFRFIRTPTSSEDYNTAENFLEQDTREAQSDFYLPFGRLEI